MTDATAPAPATAAASVLFLRWEGEPGTAPVLDDALVGRLKAALEHWDAARRLVLEAPQGLVIAGHVPPSVARDAARRLVRTADLPPLRAGLHHGDLRITPDRAVQARVSGEALHAAAAAVNAAGDDRIGISPAFASALAAQRRGTRRNILGGVGVLALLGSGLAGREALEQYEAARQPAAIQLDIRPWGDVYVDGEPKGRTPPLIRLWLPPGPHLIEVRNGKFKPVQMDVTLQPAEELELKHVFSPPTPSAASKKKKQQQQQQPSVFDRLKFW
jgi:hypothetical protein